MASNVELDSMTGGDTVTTKEYTHDGDAGTQMQGMWLASATGSEGAYGWTELQIYTENVATPAASVGIAGMYERDDALSTLAIAEGDWTHGRVDSTGALWVNVTNADGTATDDSAFTPGTGTGAVIFGFADETAADSVNEGDVGAVRMTLARELKVQPNDFLTPAGDSMVDDTNDALQVSIVSGSSAGTEYTEDAAAPANPAGPAMMLQRDDALGGLTPIEGDWTHAYANGNGALWVAVDGNITVDLSPTDNAVLDNIETNTDFGAVTGGGVEATALRVTLANDSTGVLSVDDGGGSITVDNAALTDIETNTDFGTVTGGGTEANALRVTLANNSTGVLSIDDNGGSITVDGSVGVTGAALTALQLIDNSIAAHDAAAAGSVNTAGAYATNSVEGLTQVANGDATRVTADLNGCLVTRNATTLEELISTSQTTTATTSTAATNFTAGGAGVHNYITSITIANSSATDTILSLQDGNGGTTIWVFPNPSAGGATHNFDPPLRQPTANTALYFASGAAVTTAYISINGFQAQG